MGLPRILLSVIPAQAGIQRAEGANNNWTPAFAGVTNAVIPGPRTARTLRLTLST